MRKLIKYWLLLLILVFCNSAFAQNNNVEDLKIIKRYDTTPGTAVICIKADPYSDQIYFASVKYLHKIVNNQIVIVEKWSGLNGILPGGPIDIAFEQNQIYVLCTGGVAIFNRQTKKWRVKKIINEIYNELGINLIMLSSLAVSGNDLWVTSGSWLSNLSPSSVGGVIKFNKNTLSIDTLFCYKKQNYFSRFSFDLLTDSSRNKLWVANDRGVHTMNVAEQKWKRVKGSPADCSSLNWNYNKSLVLATGFKSGGLYLIDPTKDSVVVSYKYGDGKINKPVEMSRCSVEDKSGNIFVGSAVGAPATASFQPPLRCRYNMVWHLLDHTLEWSESDPNTDVHPLKGVLSICAVGDYIYVGTLNGLYVFSEKKTLPPQPPTIPELDTVIVSNPKVIYAGEGTREIAREVTIRYEFITPPNVEVAYKFSIEDGDGDIEVISEGLFKVFTQKINGLQKPASIENVSVVIVDSLRSYEAILIYPKELSPLTVTFKYTGHDIINDRYSRQWATHTEKIWLADEPGSGNVIVAKTYELDNAYPNPYNPTGLLNFPLTIVEDQSISLTIFNILGQVVYQEKFDLAKGIHNLIWDGRGLNNALASDIYIFRLKSTRGWIENKRFTILK